MSKYKHKPTGKILEFGNKPLANSMQHLIGVEAELTMADLVKGEDWEQVKEEEYIITAFKGRNSRRLFELKNDGFYYDLMDSRKKWSLPVLLSYPNTVFIYSVKRVKDEVEFKIGDRIECMGEGRHTIERITLNEEPMIYLCSGPHAFLLISPNLKKIEPLLTTEDGVDVFEGDEGWYATIYSDKAHNLTIVKSYPNTKYIRYFSTEEKAKEWLIMNKPILSVKDVLNFIDSQHPDLCYNEGTSPISIERRIFDIVKEKLKL